MKASGGSLSGVEYLNRDGHQYIWSPSAIDSLQACPRRYYYTYIKGWRTKTPSIHLVFGGLFSQALEHYYSPKGTLVSTIRLILTLSHNNPIFQDEKLKTRYALIRAIVDYIDHYSVTDAPDILYTETPFHISLTDGIYITSRFDLVKEVDEQLFILDQKTTRGGLTSTFFHSFTPNNQMSMYAFAGRVVFNRPVQNIIIDGVQILKNSTHFARGIVSRSTAYLNEWAEGVTTFINKWNTTADPAREADWPQTPSACGYYGGCPFREVCSQSPAARPAYLLKDFTQDE